MIAWNNNFDSGGCPLIGFAVFRDNGDNTEAIVEVNSSNDPTIRSSPTASTFTATYFPSNSVGNQFKFRILALNSAGSTYSKTSSFILAGLPPMPASSPTQNVATTTSSQIGLSWTELSTQTQTGGSTILDYEVMIEINGSYISVVNTTSLSATITQGIVKGTTYGLKYRARSLVGSGQFSDARYITAASVPSTPGVPTIASADSTQITLNFVLPEDNGGLEMDMCQIQMETKSTSALTIISSYSQTSMATTHQMLVGSDGITTGEIYTFKFSCHSASGWSNWSLGV